MVLCTINTSYCEADSVYGDVSVRRVANVKPDCCCLCASKICVSAFMKGVISCREHKDMTSYMNRALSQEDGLKMCS